MNLKYVFRSLILRRGTTLSAVFGIALVVFVINGILMVAAGFDAVLARSGRADTLVVLGKSATNEAMSTVPAAAVRLVSAQPSIRKAPDGRPMVSSEVLAQMQVRQGQSFTMMLYRGVSADALLFRPAWQITEGRAPSWAADEAVVGTAFSRRYPVGSVLELAPGRRTTVVGVFSDAGSVHESEIWLGIDNLRMLLSMPGAVSSVHVALADGVGKSAIQDAIAVDKSIRVSVESEHEYEARQSGNAIGMIRGIAGGLGVMMALCAGLGAMITMLESLASRQRELGTLRALGFSSGTLVRTVVLESLMIGVAGAITGILSSSLLQFARVSVNRWPMGPELTLQVTLTSQVAVIGFVIAILTAFIAGLIPAIRALSVSPLAAIREP